MLRLTENHLAEVPLTAAQAAELAGLSRATGKAVIERIRPTRRPGVYAVTAGLFVGRVALSDGLVVDIASRFPFLDLAEMLRIAFRAPALLKDPSVAQAGGRGLVEALARALVREAEKVIGAGLAKRYTPRRFVSPPYPGVPDVSTHLRLHGGRADRLVTRATRLTVDTAENRVLAAAVRVLRGHPILDGLTRARLGKVAAGLGGVTIVRDALAAPSLGRTPPRGYGPVLSLARLILHGSVLTTADGGHRGASILFSMPQVWEAFVEARLRSQLATGHRLQAQHPIGLTDSGPAQTASADLVEFDLAGSAVRVIDAKYSAYSAKPRAEHLYQVFTYAHRLDVADAVLVHPGAGEVSRSRTGSVRITTVGLSVGSGPEVRILAGAGSLDGASRTTHAVDGG